MKANSLFIIVLMAVIATANSSCVKDSCERKITYKRLDPVYKSIAEIRSGTAEVEPPRPMKNPGALYYYNDKIFVNERNEGIHVIDNSFPSNPIAISFIAIPGNESFAIKDGVIYANSYIDLLAINLDSYTEVGRTEGVFPPLWEDVENNLYAVSYIETEVTEEFSCDESSVLYFEGDQAFDLSNFGNFSGNVSTLTESGGGRKSNGGTGIGGSMARFTIVGDYLYVVDQTSLDVFSLANPTAPTATSTVEVGWGIETIFPYEDKLFIGSNTGMYIYDNTNPTSPSYLSQFNHAQACDPVFVKGDYAYVTLRSSTSGWCTGTTNQLDLIDISNILSPTLVNSFPMQNPHGLSIANNNLFLCEGEFGLKSFDISQPAMLDQHQLDHEMNLHAYDAISLDGPTKLLLVIGEDGFYQYNSDDPANLQLLSVIPVQD